MTTNTAAPRIALISGSTRKDSINGRAVKAIAAVFKSLGAKPTIISLTDYDMPIYNGDLEDAHGVPETAKKLIRRLKRFDGVYISTPEYNGSLPALLKNTIDWTTRVELGHLTGPVYGIGACSPGATAGVVAARELHLLLARLGCHVVPVYACIGNADSAFDAKGKFLPGRGFDQASLMADKMLADIARRR